MDRESQQKLFEAVESVLKYREQHLTKESVEPITEAPRTSVTHQVESMSKWLEPLKELLGSTMAPSAKNKFVTNYANWVKANGHFYQSALRTNPALAEVFGVLEDAFKIEVHIKSGGSRKKASDIDEDVISEQGEQPEFIATFVDMVEKVPSTSIKSRFVYQFEKWKRENPNEVKQLSRAAPTIDSFINSVVASMNPNDDLEDIETDDIDLGFDDTETEQLPRQ